MIMTNQATKSDYELAITIIEKCKKYIPVPFTDQKKYLIADCDGNLIDFVQSLDCAQVRMEEYAYEKYPKLAHDSKYFVGVDPPVFTITLLSPNSHWSKKWRLHQSEPLSYLSDDFPLGADSFYDQTYLSDVAKENSSFAEETEKNERLRRESEKNDVIRKIVIAIILLLWLFGGFSWIET